MKFDSNTTAKMIEDCKAEVLATALLENTDNAGFIQACQLLGPDAFIALMKRPEAVIKDAMNKMLLVQNTKGWAPLHVAPCFQQGESFQVFLAQLPPLSTEAWTLKNQNGWTPLLAAAYYQDSATFIRLLLCLPTEKLSSMLSMDSSQTALNHLLKKHLSSNDDLTLDAKEAFFQWGHSQIKHLLTEKLSRNDKLTPDEKKVLSQLVHRLIERTLTLEELKRWIEPVAQQGTAMMKEHLGFWYRDFCQEEGHESSAITWFQFADEYFDTDLPFSDKEDTLQNQQTALYQIAKQEELDEKLLLEEKEMPMSIDEKVQQILVLQVQLFDKAQKYPEQPDYYAALQMELTNMQQVLHRLYSRRIDTDTMLTTLKERIAELETKPILTLSSEEQDRLQQALQKSQYCADLQTKFALWPYAQCYYTEFATYLIASISSVRTVCGGFVAASASDSVVSSQKEQVATFIIEHLDKVEHCGVPGLSLVAAVIGVLLKKAVDISRKQAINRIQDFFGSISAECFAEGLSRMLTEYHFAEFSVLSPIKTEDVKSKAKQDVKTLLEAIITRQCLVQDSASAEEKLNVCYTTITQAKWTALWVPYLGTDILAQSTPTALSSPSVLSHSLFPVALLPSEPVAPPPNPTSDCCLIL